MSSWFYLEGVFGGVVDRKTLQNGTQLATFLVTEEARGKQEASTYSLTGFKEVAGQAEKIKAGMPVVAKCKLDSRSYQDKNGQERRSTELKAFALYLGANASAATPVSSKDDLPF